MNKTLLGLCALILIAGGAYAFYAKDPSFKQSQMPSYAADTPDTTDVSQATTTDATSEDKHSVVWKFDDAGTAKDGSSKTKVTVIWDGAAHDAGTYEGSCSEIDGSAGTLQDGEVSGALCWFAGAGDEIGIFDDNGQFVLKHGEQQEPSGESQGFRGNFKTILTL